MKYAQEEAMILKKRYKWMKHLDFMILDTICCIVSLLIASVIRGYIGGTRFVDMLSAWEIQKTFRTVLMVFVGSHIIITFVSDTFSGVLARSALNELRKAVWHNVKLLVVTVVLLYSINLVGDFSRFVMGVSVLLNTFLMWGVNCLWKSILLSKKTNVGKERLIIITDQKHLDETIDEMTDGPDNSFIIEGIGFIKDPDEKTGKKGERYRGYEILGVGKDIFQYCVSNVVDGVVINLGKAATFEMREYAEKIVDMGITVHMVTNIFIQDMKYAQFDHFNNARTISTSIHAYSTVDRIVKRTSDIIMSLFGLIATGILFLIVGPMIKIADPSGPILFKQERVGKKGRKFYMYKFRTMYSDAEERKKELMARNEMQGHMFKIDGDPRILGSGPDGKRKGLGYWLRVWSIDEFPNSISIFKGDMSVIGTRPPTVDEYQKYELHHKSRLAVKPGLTGLWQVSGRSDITDFEEIVKLDNEYIRNWSLGLDARIALKTILVVLGRRGSR